MVSTVGSSPSKSNESRVDASLVEDHLRGCLFIDCERPRKSDQSLKSCVRESVGVEVDMSVVYKVGACLEMEKRCEYDRAEEGRI